MLVVVVVQGNMGQHPGMRPVVVYYNPGLLVVSVSNSIYPKTSSTDNKNLNCLFYLLISSLSFPTFFVL